MRRLWCIAVLLVLATAGTALAGAPQVTRTGDVSLLTKFKLDDAMTGAPGYRRALWTSAQPVRAVLRVRNAKGRLVETVVGGNPYSRTAAIAWIDPRGQMVNRSFPPAGMYHLTLVVNGYVTGSTKLVTSRSETVVWSARIPDHTKLCVPKVTSQSDIGCG